MGYSHWNFMVGLKDYRSRIIPVAGSEVSHLLLGAAGMTEFPKNSHFTLFKRGKCNLGSHSLYGTDGLKIHGTQEGRKALCCSQLLVHQFHGLDWEKHQNSFFPWKRFPVLSKAWWDFQSNSKMLFLLLQVFFPLVLSTLTLFPLPPPIYPRKWGCLGNQWEEGRSCWLCIRRLLGGSYFLMGLRNNLLSTPLEN